MPEGAKVLVVEDDAVIAMVIEDVLYAMGAKMLGPATSLAEAEKLARTETFDVALIDVSIRDGKSFPVADILVERGIPFLFTTGYGAGSLAEAHRNRPLLGKPYTTEELETELLRILANR